MPKKLSHALVHKFPSMLEYKSPTSLDMPEVFTELIEEPDPRGPFGAKEVGQGPLLPIMPAVANAVYDAVGVRIDEVPITPEKIMKALAEKKAGREPRFGPSHFPHVNWPEALRVPPPWEGGDGNAVNDVPRPRKAPRRERKGAQLMMRLPLFEFRAPRTLGRSGAHSGRRGSKGHAACRRHGSAPQHEAKATGSADADEPALYRRA